MQCLGCGKRTGAGAAAAFCLSRIAGGHEACCHLSGGKGIKTHNFLDDDIGELYVFGWMPAVSVYFKDPDGHSLEFISMLPDEAKPELGMVPWSTWEKMHGRA